MAFQNIVPQTQLVLPTGGPQTPGSGTTVIGGQLPPELAGYGNASGIVWWSNAAGLANGFAYTYLVNVNGLPVFGYVLTTGGGANTMQINPDQTVLGGSLQLNPSQFSQSVSTHIELANSFWSALNDASDSYITDRGGKLDVWSGVLTGPTGTVNGGAYTSTYQYFVSYDRMVTFNFTITFSTAPTVGPAPFPAFIPAAIRPAGGGQTWGSARVSYNSTPAVCNAQSSGMLNVYNLVAQLQTVQGTVQFPTAKPTF